MKRGLSVLLISLMLMPVVSSQGPDIEQPEWDIGWVLEEDTLYMDLDSDTYRYSMIIEFWVDNSRPIPLDVDLDAEFDIDAEMDYPSQVSVGANSNETFEIELTGSGINSDGGFLDAKSNRTLTLNAQEVLGEQSIGSNEIEQILKFSSLHQFTVSFSGDLVANDEIKSGTDEDLDVVITNSGNTIDAISQIDYRFSGCPQMNYAYGGYTNILSDTGADRVTDKPLEKGTAIPDVAYTTMNLEAPSGHPDKSCKFMVDVTSEGNGKTYSGIMEFTVEKIESISNENNEESGDKDTNSDSSDFAVEDNSLPAISSLLCILTVIFSAVIRRNDPK